MSTYKVFFTILILTYFCVGQDQAFAQNAQQAPCSIGAFLAITHRTEGDRLQIMGVFSNSPAERAGLIAGQIVRAIDGSPTTGLKYIDCVKRIQGEEGTKVVLEVEDRRRGWTNLVELTREIVADDPLAIDTTTWVDIQKSQKLKSLKITTNQIVRVSETNGNVTFIQFIQFGVTNATYRWSSCTVSGGAGSAGSGVVFADYDRHTIVHDIEQLTHRGSPDDLYVKAGDVRMEWSCGGDRYGWLYYCSANGKVEVFDRTAFNSIFK